MTVLANGNYVVADPNFSLGGIASVGAVYLYDGATSALISTLTGSSVNDSVGFDGVVEVGSNNVLVRSPFWNNGAATSAGAATWMSGVTGLNGVVSSANSPVGSSTDDRVAFQGVVRLTNGNYVVRTPAWDRGGVPDAGAATWGSGNAPTVGVIVPANSLVGARAGDNVSSGGVAGLTNGNYVVGSYEWDLSAVVADAQPTHLVVDVNGAFNT